MLVLRPADVEETTIAWKLAMENTSTPTGLIFSRQNIANPIFRKNDAIIGFLGFGSKFSGVISPDHSVRLAFSVKIRSFSTTNLAGKELENSL